MTVNLNTDYFLKCIVTLEHAYVALEKESSGSVIYDIYRAACIKEFELILEQTGKLFRKVLKRYFSSSKQVDQLSFKDVFRYAGKFQLLTLEEVERWLLYRDNRNDRAHDYGEGFAEETLKLLPKFIQDAYHANDVLNAVDDV